MIICGRERVDAIESTSPLLYVNSFDLLVTNFWKQIQADYDLVQEVIRRQGFHALSGRMGQLIQPRTKGKGHGSITRAFYARVAFVESILGLQEADTACDILS